MDQYPNRIIKIPRKNRGIQKVRSNLQEMLVVGESGAVMVACLMK